MQSEKPKNIKPDYTVDATGIIEHGCCPVCNADVTNYYNYCPKCGKKLDWLPELPGDSVNESNIKKASISQP